MAEHLLCKQGVSGSNPLTSTNWVGAMSDSADEVPFATTSCLSTIEVRSLTTE